MVSNTQQTLAHWNYLLAIESDLEVLSRFIEFDEKNYNSFSLEIARILLTSSSEIDVVCKQLCRKIDQSSSAGNIHQYRDEIILKYPQIIEFTVSIPRYDLTLKPWISWNDPNSAPKWWTAYNKVKHQRESYYESANLENVINSVTGLFVLNLYFYKRKAELGELMPNTKILRVTDERFRGISHGSYDLSFVFDLS